MGIHLKAEGAVIPPVDEGDGIPNTDVVDEGPGHRPSGQGLAEVRDDSRQSHGSTRPAVEQASGPDEDFHGLSRHGDGVDSFLHDLQLLFKIKIRGSKMLLHSAAPRGWVTGWFDPPFLCFLYVNRGG